ncbi:MAG TPA: 3-deoxy-manno-octulosonate cytidylyltransferase, partial [Planctomycetota bacterium]|nr:3-deoxy-manno-octulosonate cytidylyltransferase [Planctomycetota bacterium]
MSVAIILPARLASTRLPNKLLLDRTGKTVLEHTIDRAKEARAKYPHLFTTVRVACDDEKLIAAAKRGGVDAVMTRKDHQSGTDRIAEACAGLKEDIIVNLQADEPEINPDYIAKVAELLTLPEHELFGRKPANDAPMATLATFIYDESTFRNPNVVKVVRNEFWNRALYFSRAPIPYSRDGSPLFQTNDGKHVFGLHHIGIYAYRRE